MMPSQLAVVITCDTRNFLLSAAPVLLRFFGFITSLRYQTRPSETCRQTTRVHPADDCATAFIMQLEGLNQIVVSTVSVHNYPWSGDYLAGEKEAHENPLHKRKFGRPPNYLASG